MKTISLDDIRLTPDVVEKWKNLAQQRVEDARLKGIWLPKDQMPVEGARLDEVGNLVIFVMVPGLGEISMPVPRSEWNWVKLPNLEQIYKLAESTNPTLWRKCYPRVYRDVSNYGSIKAVAATLMSGVIGIGAESSALQAVGIAALKLFRFGVPTFFLATEFAQAVALSNPPPETCWTDLHLPYDAGVFMLPNGFLSHAGHRISFLGYARISKNEDLRIPGREETFFIDNDVFIVFTAYTDEKGFPILSQSLEADKAPTIDVEHLDQNLYINGAFDVAMTGDEQSFLRQAMGLVFRVLLAVDARPQFFTKGKRREVSRKTGLETWSPNFLGKSYCAKREVAARTSGEYTSPRLHWRRGHFRRQRYGQDYAEVRTIWIEPTLVGEGSSLLIY